MSARMELKQPWQTKRQLIDAMERDRAWFDRMTDLTRTIPGWRPWPVFYDPGHYADHCRAIEEWLARSAP